MNAFGERDYHYTHSDFETIRALIYQHAGITLADGKQQLVYSRLSRRLRALELDRFSDYIALLEPAGPEWQLFINALTTNLTAFFREPHHFPALAHHVRSIQRRPIRIWSAASSSGEEAYSIAITMAELFGRLDAPVQILASDVDTQVLEQARSGIYPLERLEKIPLEQKRRFFHRGGGARSGYARVLPALQELVTFRQLNLLGKQWPIEHRFDAIFCRNVMIYFDKPTQRTLLGRFVRIMQPDGLFFAGHSESFFHADDIITSIGKTVYRPAGTVSQRGGDDDVA
jgi:chemotaxis protein methyltransferase CheR